MNTWTHKKEIPRNDVICAGERFSHLCLPHHLSHLHLPGFLSRDSLPPHILGFLPLRRGANPPGFWFLTSLPVYKHFHPNTPDPPSPTRPPAPPAPPLFIFMFPVVFCCCFSNAGIRNKILYALVFVSLFVVFASNLSCLCWSPLLP